MQPHQTPLQRLNFAMSRISAILIALGINGICSERKMHRLICTYICKQDLDEERINNDETNSHINALRAIIKNLIIGCNNLNAEIKQELFNTDWCNSNYENIL